MICELCEKEITSSEAMFKTPTGHEHYECHLFFNWMIDNPKLARRILDGIDKG